jgi:PAS domain S-box-containing protein
MRHADGTLTMQAFRSLFGRPDQYALLLARDHTVLEATPAARRLFGLVQAGMVPLPEFPPEVDAAIAEAFQGRTARYELAPGDRRGEGRHGNLGDNHGGAMAPPFELTVQPVGTGDVVDTVLLQAVPRAERRSAERVESLLSRIALAVGQTDNVSLAVEVTLRAVCQATGWAMGEAWIPSVVEEDEPVLVPGGSWSSKDARVETFAAQATGLRFRRGEGIPGSAWAAGTPAWMSDLRNVAHFTRAPLAAAAGLRAAVAIPLVHPEGEITAMLVFFMRDVPPDNDRLVQLASAVATPLAQLLRQKQSEEAHRLAESRFTGMVSMASDAIISIDSARRITLFNWGAEKIFGYDAAEAIGQLLDILLPEDLRSRHAAHISAFAASSETTRRMGERSRIVGLRKNGEIFPAEASISRFLAGGEWAYTVILRDVSERVRAEEQLRALADRAQRAVASRDEVMALVSHDLRNPLSNITMCLSGLQDDPPPSPEMASRLVTLAQESATLMSRMIQDLLDIASIDAGRLSIERAAQPLGPMLRHVIEMHRLVAAEQRIALDADIPAELDRHAVTIDGERIAQVLANLIGNACKFTDAEGRVTVEARELPDAMRITVRDTGRGIPVDAIPHVFDRFWYARHGAVQRSTGLGLAIARGIVEAHGGRIWVESTVGQGSVFHFTLPPADDATAAARDGSCAATSDNDRQAAGETPSTKERVD